MANKVSHDATLYTDEFPSYDHMARFGYKHKRIDHHSKIYVNGDIHTNSIEGFWSLVKRGISGVYHSVSPKYLQLYLNQPPHSNKLWGMKEPSPTRAEGENS